MTLDELNAAPKQTAADALLSCCGSLQWAEQMLTCRPWASQESLQAQAEETWFALSPKEWLVAFSKHPKIGENSSAKWSSEEQNGMSNAQQATADAIQRMNAAYQLRFGYIFIICATGKTAEQMRDALEQRLCHQPEQELSVAAAEQARIIRLRLQKLLTE